MTKKTAPPLVCACVCCASVLLAVRTAAGPLFDDYLNHLRPGPGTGPAKSRVEVTSSRSLTQTIILPDSVGEIYRIGVRPLYDTWNPGETVTMALFDSPEKEHALGSYSIDEATSRVQDYKTGDGSKASSTGDHVLYFQFRKTVKGGSQVCFELSVAGGDGSVAFQAFDTDAYPQGELRQARHTEPVEAVPKDIAFECHIKPVADREANLRAFFTERLDISRPELSAVRSAVDAGDWERAIAETVRHFHERMEIWQDWKDVMHVSLDPKFDTTQADLLVRVAKGDRPTGVNWRPESYWAPDKSVATGIPSTYLWHIDRTLGIAYTATGKEEYARACIDLRMRFILDNPNPKTSGVPWYFELWNDRAAAARTPGHGDLVYARLYNFPGWTNDEKMVFFCFIEDNARWVYQATSGANWGVEAAKACYEFGVKFPEWKMSPKYVSWGTRRLAEVVLQDVRKDGTSTEAAIKYHAMVARRLRGMLEDHISGAIKLDEDVHARLMQVVEAMYDHMAHTLQPNGYVVMCGDSWYENYTEELDHAGKLLNRPDFCWIATQGKTGSPPEAVGRSLPSGRSDRVPQASKVYPGGGYFIMRSDFGGPGLDYSDARQLFIHNGGWFGSHGHHDLTCVNLYGFGRTLIVDPGQYAYEPPEGIDRYWNSRVHSMLTCEDRDTEREPGPSEWVTTSVLDWFDGLHNGYRKLGDVQSVRRRIAFVKPDYFIFDDFADGAQERQWSQVWNLTDPNARFDAATGAIETTFADGGNVLILSQDPGSIRVRQAPGITSSEDAMHHTRIFRLDRKAAAPRFRTLVYPYRAGMRPDLTWDRIAPDGDLPPEMCSLRVSVGGRIDWAAFGESGKAASYRGGAHRSNADFALVRLSEKGAVSSFAWANGRELRFNKHTLASAGAAVHSLSVSYLGAQMRVEAAEPDSTLAIRVAGATSIVLNGRPVAKPVIRNGMYYPFADLPAAIVADDRDRFERITQTSEWGRVAEPESWATGYTRHETDPGRRESGSFVFQVPRAATYRIEVFLPRITMDPSDRVEYVIPAMGRPAGQGGAVLAVREDQDATVVTVNQQSMAGWVRLGDFALQPGVFRVTATNVTQTDGVYFVADAMRLVSRDR